MDATVPATDPDGRPAGPTDAELVARAVAGDRAAFAAIYDRHADRVHTTCRHLLGDPDDAADCTGDVFLLAAQRLSQLRDPERLRPWLFAIARHEAYRRTRRRRREIPTDTMDDHLDHLSADEPLDADPEALRRLVADAAAGLDERDRSVLALQLGGGLDGEGLALALGTSVGTAQVAAHRMRERLATSLGALLVARQGREDCAELARVLGDWDGRFSVLLRKRVARHVAGCEICERRRRNVPATLFGVGPALAAPTSVRDRVLGELDLVAHHGRPWSRSGFPPAHPARRHRAAVVLGTVVVLVLLAAAGWRWGGDGDVVVTDTDRAAAPASTAPAPTTAEPGPTTSAAPTSTSAAPATTTSTSAPATTTSTTTTRVPRGATVGVTPTSVDFGATDASRTVTATNTGDRTATVAVVEDLAWLATSTATATLVPGASATFTLVVDRTGLPEGVADGVVTIAVEGATATPVAVQVTTAHPPMIVLVRPPSRFSLRGSCPIVANVTDDGTVASVWAEYTDQGGAVVTVPLVGPQGTTWSGAVVVGSPPRTVTWRVVAVDAAGNRATTPDRTATTGSTCAF